MSARRVVLTGAVGGIGTYVAIDLVAAGFEVVGVDRRPPGAQLESVFSRFYLIDASEGALLADACEGSEAVVHLAGIPSPTGAEKIVFQNNVVSTYRVLEAAAEAGIRSAVIASSVSALGLVYAPERFSPLYVPIDEEHPLRPCDPYALAKQCDEHTAAMFARRIPMTVLAFRFPFTTTADRIEARSRLIAGDPTEGERELWAYLDVRDAARAVRLGVQAALSGACKGYAALNIIAEDAMADVPLVDLVRRFHPKSEIRGELGARSCGYTVAKAEQLIGFRAEHLR
jgi:nucleoside-diphosphate-sugar epimerase